ncbi:MAG: hypothetical protein UY76_C0011G0001 [Candidatus Uhrbacteria bacterium GW2011_GWA2_52_8d]|uniref:Uncharacterized protein n=1 Tax=Candidatus Uhrbacteria bacterium GW2011_GWA2_52_8d TaxID=1618979 RepID=A0A0G1XQ55_9BACT|nr:MAG: hypothetical protein UY76_C0011G0001 [Candidatus Uhrbacteria bacterium GW2011_GWA2_52_8d]
MHLAQVARARNTDEVSTSSFSLFVGSEASDPLRENRCFRLLEMVGSQT